MERLPQEILDLIATFIECYPGQTDLSPWERTHPSDPSNYYPYYSAIPPCERTVPSHLSNYSTVSRAWKHTIECITFRKITLKSTEIDAFGAILSGDRRQFLTDLTIFVELPNCDAKAGGLFERAAKKRANNEAFNDLITKLFAIFKAWEEDESIEGSLCLTLWGLCTPFDIRNHDFNEIRQHFRKGTLRSEPSALRYLHSLIHLPRLDHLPSIRRVSRFNFGAPLDFNDPIHGCNLAMPAVVDIIAKFPNLEIWDCTLHDNEKLHVASRVTNRHSFASVLSRRIFPFVKIINLSFFHEAPFNQNLTPSDLRDDQFCDPLSTALRMTLSQCPNLTSLTLRGVFDSSLFWPTSKQTPGTPNLNYWPNLQFLTVTFDLTTPSGHWYFTNQSGTEPNVTSPVKDDDSESVSDDVKVYYDRHELDCIAGITPDNNFRTYPNSTHLNPLIVAFANLIKTTTSPSLLQATLTTGPVSVDDPHPFQFEIGYYAPNMYASYGDQDIADTRFPRLHLEVGEWVRDQEVLKALTEAAWSQWKTKLLVRFLPSQFLKREVYEDEVRVRAEWIYHENRDNNF